MPPRTANSPHRAAHSRVALAVARYVLVEAWRSGLPWIALAGAAGAFALAAFLSRVAITEGAAVQASVSAAVLRAFAVFLVAAHTIASVNREANDKGLELALTLPIGRPAWYSGKLLGYAATGSILAVVLGLPLLLTAAAADVACWSISLAAELAVIAAAALFFASALPHAVAALAAVAGLYLLARVMPAIQAIAAGPLHEDSAAGQLARWALEAVALLLPRLHGVASGDWLLYGAPATALQLQALAGLILYFLLLAAAGLFDFSRRNF
jgi:ABC-type transport system involved in multi-copper enzyme maturation permease subunit